MNIEPRTVAVTGANGFIGSNLVVRLREAGHRVDSIGRGAAEGDVREKLAEADVVFHLAGCNRSDERNDFDRDNAGFSELVAGAIAAGGNRPLLVYSSSAKAGEDSDYGRTKLAAEQALMALASQGQATVSIWRLPNVFGKWARPDYNSAVATFCHNIARGLPIRIDDPAAPIDLLYIDDLMDQWLQLLETPTPRSGLAEPGAVHRTSVGQVAETIESFDSSRSGRPIGDVGYGLERALYATFVAALPTARAAYALEAHDDQRGRFIEMLRTHSCGQISVLTAPPGTTRGGHYHHSKVEKFLVVRGQALFRFRHVLNGERFEKVASAAEPEIVETIPGWTHDLTNIGTDEMIAMIWASELFDPRRPDTIAMPL